MIERLIRCIKCNQVLPNLQDGGDISILPMIELSEEDLAYRRDFDRSHGNHPREELRVDPETFFSEKPSYEPFRTSYFEATNGQQRFLIKRTKPGLLHPASYEVLPGKMQISSIDILTQDEEMRGQISADPGVSVLSEEKVQTFITLLKEEVGGILPHNLHKEVEMILEGDIPLFAYAALKNLHWEKILARCAQEFDPSELKGIREFIAENRQPGEVLSLLIRRKMSILPQESSVSFAHESELPQ
jgi:hypothetical protein